MTTRVVDEDPAHDLRGHAEEVRPILPVDLPLINQSQIHLVNERRRLQAVAGSLAPQLARGDPAELRVDERQQLIERAPVTATPISEESRHIARRSHLPSAEDLGIGRQSQDFCSSADPLGPTLARSQEEPNRRVPTPGKVSDMILDELSASTKAAFVFCGALSCALAQTSQTGNDRASQARHVLSGPPTTLVTLTNDSEGLTVDPATGTMYTAEAPDLSGECIVRSITMGGAVSLVGVVPKPLGGACAPRGLEFRSGRVYISDQGTGANGWVFEMDPATGLASTYASGAAGANGIAFDPTGNLWITDGLRGLGRVYKRDAATGMVQELFRVPPVANGTTYGGRLSGPTASGIGRQIVNVPSGPQGEVRAVANGIAVVEQDRDAILYVADTARGAVWVVRLDEHGDLAPGQTGCDLTLQDNTLCENALLVAHPRLEGADGMWAGPDGSLWVAANSRQAIVRVDRWGNVTDQFRNPVNSQLLRSSADTVEGNTHVLEYPTNPVLVPTTGWPAAWTLCVASTDRPGRDNWPGTTGEIGGPGQDKGKISCF